MSCSLKSHEEWRSHGLYQTYLRDSQKWCNYLFHAFLWLISLRANLRFTINTILSMMQLQLMGPTVCHSCITETVNYTCPITSSYTWIPEIRYMYLNHSYNNYVHIKISCFSCCFPIGGKTYGIRQSLFHLAEVVKEFLTSYIFYWYE